MTLQMISTGNLIFSVLETLEFCLPHVVKKRCESAYSALIDAKNQGFSDQVQSQIIMSILIEGPETPKQLYKDFAPFKNVISWNQHSPEQTAPGNVEQFIYENVVWDQVPFDAYSCEAFAELLNAIVGLTDLNLAKISACTSQVAYCLAKNYGLSKDVATLIKASGYFLNIGKIGLPEHIRFVDNPTNEEDIQRLKQQPYLNFKILKYLDGYKDLVLWATTLHEHKDLEKGIESEVLKLAEKYAQLKTVTPYQIGVPIEHIITELSQQAGILYNPELVKCLKQNLGDIEENRQNAADKLSRLLLTN